MLFCYLYYNEGVNPAYQFGDQSQEICHFIAANGYPPAAYQQLFKQLDYGIKSPLLRPLWPDFPKPKIRSWFDFVDDLVPYVEQNKPKLVAGHSIGAILWVMYAIKYNYSFEKIVLIDPALFPVWQCLVFKLCRIIGIHRKVHPLIPVTLRRQTTFRSKEEILENYQKKRIFSRFSEKALVDYINSIFTKKDDQFRLCYSPEWEAVIYEYGLREDIEIWKKISSIRSKIILIQGEYSDISTPLIQSKLEMRCVDVETYRIKNATHLVPLECPDEVANIISR